FEDDFEEDRGWEVGVDATRGAWVRGNPVPTQHGGARAQPGRCAGGENCWFTGQNPDALPDDADVAGGSTVLTSPPFDLGGAVAATVKLRRFFYKSQPGDGARMQVDLFVPDAEQPGEWGVYPLEVLDAPTADERHNVWTPREYAACGVPMEN